MLELEPNTDYRNVPPLCCVLMHYIHLTGGGPLTISDLCKLTSDNVWDILDNDTIPDDAMLRDLAHGIALNDMLCRLDEDEVFEDLCHAAMSTYYRQFD